MRRVQFKPLFFVEKDLTDLKKNFSLMGIWRFDLHTTQPNLTPLDLTCKPPLASLKIDPLLWEGNKIVHVSRYLFGLEAKLFLYKNVTPFIFTTSKTLSPETPAQNDFVLAPYWPHPWIMERWSIWRAPALLQKVPATWTLSYRGENSKNRNETTMKWGKESPPTKFGSLGGDQLGDFVHLEFTSTNPLKIQVRN